MDWQAMVVLGAYHGINPGMGWLFAVALGLQQGSARGVWRALPPLVAGHALSIAAVLAAVGLARIVVPLDALNTLVAALLISMGVYRLWRHGHPRFGGMQVGFRDLAVWSFLMASAHGAGLMVLPFVMATPTPLSAAGHDHAHHIASGTTNLGVTDAMAVGVHTMAYFIVMTLVAWIVYRKLGLNLLRTAWFNVDLVWAAALVVTGIVVLLR
ncbi:MAG TPA: hypothetical protein VFS23_16180 [Vicinamibacterales bacterium]|nr:hypothetical protein [Vicinamibacterales bacterium]